MKTLNILIFVTAILGTSFIISKPDNTKDNYFKENAGIKFENISFEEALKKAKKENKLIFIDAYAEWCGPCKMMDRTTFKSMAVGNVFNKHFINLKIDMEKGEGPQLARKYQVNAYPTLFLIDATGRVQKRLLGMMDENDLLNNISDFVK